MLIDKQLHIHRRPSLELDSVYREGVSGTRKIHRANLRRWIVVSFRVERAVILAFPSSNPKETITIRSRRKTKLSGNNRERVAHPGKQHFRYVFFFYKRKRSMRKTKRKISLKTRTKKKETSRTSFNQTQCSFLFAFSLTIRDRRRASQEFILSYLCISWTFTTKSIVTSSIFGWFNGGDIRSSFTDRLPTRTMPIHFFREKQT